jgi:two-component sensor histidine kinase
MDVERRGFGDAAVRHVGSDDRLSEAQHRIANNLALIAGYTRLQASRLDKAGKPLTAREACIVLEEVAARIETVGELHRLLSDVSGQSETDVDLGQFLAKLCASLMETVSFAGETTIIHADAGGCVVRPDQATPVALIVSELVTNALKYAHPAGVAGRITVSCRPLGRDLDGGLAVEVTDDGVGLSEDFNPLTDGGLGFRVVRGLARQLGATLAYESTGVGLTVRLTLGAEDEHRVISLWPAHA